MVRLDIFMKSSVMRYSRFSSGGAEKGSFGGGTTTFMSSGDVGWMFGHETLRIPLTEWR